MKKEKQNFKGLFLLSICLLSFIFLLYGEVRRETSIENSQLIGYANKKNLYTKANKDKILNILSNATGVIFIANESDDIKKVFNVLYECALINNQVINFYDITNDESIIELDKKDKISVIKNSSEFYDKLLSSLGAFTEVYSVTDSKGNLIDTGYKKIYTPFVVFVKEGQVVYSHYVTNTDIDKESSTILKDTYLKGFEMIKK